MHLHPAEADRLFTANFGVSAISIRGAIGWAGWKADVRDCMIRGGKYVPEGPPWSYERCKSAMPLA